MIKVNPTDRLVFDLEMFQIDFNEQKKESLRKEISEKYGVPLKNVPQCSHFKRTYPSSSVGIEIVMWLSSLTSFLLLCYFIFANTS